MKLATAVQWYVEGRISRQRAEAIAGVESVEFANSLAYRNEVHPDLAPIYALNLLGLPTTYRVREDGTQVELEWKLHKALETLAFLALAPSQRATKEEIVEAVWWESGTDAIAKNFHPTLSYARKSLGSREALALRNGSYVLDSEMGWRIDVLEFEELVSAGQHLLEATARGDQEVQDLAQPVTADRALELWRRAWKLYHGPLLSGRESPWILHRRDELRRTYLRMLADLGRVAESRGKETLALDSYRSVLIEDPYDEHIHLRMMTLYSRQGRRDLVRRQYVRLQELLLRELNEEPSEETQERYHQLMGK